MTERPPIGTMTRRTITVDVCRECGKVIDNGLCEYGCDNECLNVRPPNSTLRVTYERVDTLVSEEIV